ncbi:MAG: hypothetical protein V1672_02330 [Candidatus Diapherotrites archaeon]
MTTKNSILLIIKQNQGIEYNSLLNKLSSSYNSVNSARAALSRALKDLNALGMIQRKGNNIYMTNKGTAFLNTEMKNKLLIKLSNTVKTRNPISEIDTLVQQLHTLIERSKEDSDLLKAAKGSADFYISDLTTINMNLEKRTKHLHYLQKVLGQQIELLEKMNFNDSKTFKWNKKTYNALKALPKITDADSFIMECFNDTFFLHARTLEGAKTQTNNIFFDSKSLPHVLDLISKNTSFESNRVNLYFPLLKVSISYPDISFIGPHAKIKEITKNLSDQK